MRIWESLIFVFSLMGSNFIILRKILFFEEKTRISPPYYIIALGFPILYGAAFFYSGQVSQNFSMVAYGVFFINNVWLLVFLRNAIVSYNRTLAIGKYFLWTIIGFLIPVSAILFVNPTGEFTQIIFNTSYLLGLFPMSIFVSMLLGVSVDSTFWGVVSAIFFFSIDFALRTGFFPFIPQDYHLVSSEVFRLAAIALCSQITVFGRQIQKNKDYEPVKGTKRLNNLLFMLLTIFPVMIFYTSFWQVNINHRQLQENEMKTSKEIFHLSLHKLEDYSNRFSRLIEDAANSTNIARAQWKLNSIKLANPEIKSSQIIMDNVMPFEGKMIQLGKNEMIYYSDSSEAWGIKITIDTTKIYSQLPLKNDHQFYVFSDDEAIIAPPGSTIDQTTLSFQNKYQYAFETTKTLFGQKLNAVMIFQTSEPGIDSFTLYFILFSMFVLVLIWSFYGYYMNNWEGEVKRTLLKADDRAAEYEEKMKQLRSSMNYMNRDLNLRDIRIEDIAYRYSLLFDFLSNIDFEQKPVITIGSFFERLKKSLPFIDDLYLLQKQPDYHTIIASSNTMRNGSVAILEKDNIEKKNLNHYTMVFKDKTEIEGIGYENPEGGFASPFRIIINTQKEANEIYNLQGFVQYLFSICVLFIRQYELLRKNERAFEKSVSIIDLVIQLNKLETFAEEWLITLIKGIEKIFDNPMLCGFYTLEDNKITLRYLKDEKTVLKAYNADDEERIFEKMNNQFPFFENIEPSLSLTGKARTVGLIPAYHDSENSDHPSVGIYLEFSHYRVFSQRERELAFLLGKLIIGERS